MENISIELRNDLFNNMLWNNRYLLTYTVIHTLYSKLRDTLNDPKEKYVLSDYKIRS